MAKDRIDKKVKIVLWVWVMVASRHQLPTLPLRHEQVYHAPYVYVGVVYLSHVGWLSAMVPRGRFYGPFALTYGFLEWWWHQPFWMHCKTVVVPPRVLYQTPEDPKSLTTEFKDGMLPPVKVQCAFTPLLGVSFAYDAAIRHICCPTTSAIIICET